MEHYQHHNEKPVNKQTGFSPLERAMQREHHKNIENYPEIYY